MTRQITNQAMMRLFALLALISMVATTMPAVAFAVAFDGPVPEIILPPIVACSVTVVSDGTTAVQETEGNAQVLSFIHSAWTASIAGASWIWGNNPVVDTTVDTTQTFTKSFVWSGPITSAFLDIASDNGSVATINGNSVGAGGAFNSASHIDVSSFITQGNNTLSIAVTNTGTPGDTDPTHNPAGLLYKLTTTGTSATCSQTPTVSVSGRKWDDTNGNGIWNEGENGQDGVTIALIDSKGATTTNITNDGGYFNFGGLASGATYKVCEVIPTGATQTHPTTAQDIGGLVSCGVNGMGYTFNAGDKHASFNFGNHEIDTYEIYGSVWNDSNADDAITSEEAKLSGWTITATNVADASKVFTAVSDSNGRYGVVVPAGTWKISETIPAGWVEHSVGTNGDGTYTVTVPVVAAPVIPSDVTLAFPLNFFVTVAEAAVLPNYVGPKNFGNTVVEGRHSSRSHKDTTTDNGGSSNGGGTPAGQVLGASTSTMPVGAPKTGAGSTSPIAPTLPTLTAITTSVATLRRTK